MTGAFSSRFLAYVARAGARLESATSPAPGAADGTSVERIADFGDPAGELRSAESGAIACALFDWAAIAVTGADADAFLQGQLTNDVAALAAGATQWNAWCSPKGRVLATFPLARTGHDAFMLVVPSSLAAGLERRLRMYVLRSKVVVTPLIASHHAIGLYGGAASPEVGVGDDAIGVIAVFDYADGRRLAVVTRDEAASWWDRITRDRAPAGSSTWDLLGIRAGVAVITSPTADRFVPQMLNWELIGGVSFRKGCYPGQEIVARMQYRGRVKERLYRARIVAEGLLPGAALFAQRFGDQACGTVINAVRLPEGGTELLAVLQTASAENDRVTLSAGEGDALTLLDLPYAAAAAPEPDAADTPS